MVLANTASTALPAQTPLQPNPPAGMGTSKRRQQHQAPLTLCKELARIGNGHRQTTFRIEILETRTSLGQK